MTPLTARTPGDTDLLPAGVVGAAIARLSQGQIEVLPLGMADAATRRPITASTVFDAASLSKPLVAQLVLQLVDAGALALDEPLASMVQRPIPQALADSRITARHVLTHTSGLPNLRDNAPLRVHFEPGQRFSYSSVGFDFLQRALEDRTGEPLEALAQRLVLGPLGMTSSSFVWQPRFDADMALPHEARQPLHKHRPAVAQASWSLQTTAGDYARFLLAALEGRLLSPASWQASQALAVPVPSATTSQLEDPPPNAQPQLNSTLGWGLGWGLETKAATCFQWGKVNGVRAFVMGQAATRSGVVLLTNSNGGLRLIDTVLQHTLPGDHPAVPWLQACVTE